jgi:xanthine dehydrogenase accessory factor
MHDTLAIFQFLESHGARGEALALVTLVGATGPSSREPGAHMAVSEVGAYAGSFSGGCIEAAVVGEACAAIAQRQPRLVRFGAGSPFIDIRLPCGGGVELLISPLAQSGFANDALRLLQHRQPIEITMSLSDAPVAVKSAAVRNEARWHENRFHVHHMPPLRIQLLGDGAQVKILHAMATSFGATIEVLTPDQEIADGIIDGGGSAHVLNTLGQAADFAVDRWTACICLFHDHDWEAAPLRHAVAGGAFYVGAMGSRGTAETRRANLREAGMDEADIHRVRGPIGLMQRSRDPYTLALSVLAEVVEDYNRIVMPLS